MAPREWKEKRNAYSREENINPEEPRAKGAFKKCIEYSLKYQIFDDYARACSDWITKNDRDEYPPIVELLPRLGPSRGALSGVEDPRPNPH